MYNKCTNCLTHRITEWFGFKKGILKIISFPIPAMGSDNFCLAKLLKCVQPYPKNTSSLRAMAHALCCSSLLIQQLFFPGESRVNMARKIQMQQNLNRDRHLLECFTTHLLSSEGHELQHSKEQGS